jgi:SecD/SecF fusion protein
MNRNYFWRTLLIGLILAWSFWELTPPNNRDILKEFENRATQKDDAFKAIVTRAQALQKSNSERPFGNLIEAIGTNQITTYFPAINVADQDDPTRAILYKLQADAAGQIKLGLDLQGGTSFLVAMDFSKLGSTTFSAGDIEKLPAFIAKLKAATDPVSAFITNKLSSTTLEAMKSYSGSGAVPSALETALINDLNLILQGPSIFDPQRFKKVELRAELQPQLTNRLAGNDLIRLNRALLEEVYPTELARERALAGDYQKERVLSQAVEVLRKRVDRLGVAEPLIQPQGADRILIQLPGLSEADNDSARRQIQTAAFLEFRMVHPNSAEYIEQGIPAPGYEKMVERRRKSETARPGSVLMVKRKPEGGLTGKNVKRASWSRNYITGEPEIHFELDAQGAEIFAQVTKDNVGQRLAIVLDGVLYSAPTINTPIPNGSGQITGSFTDIEAEELANVLQNPLEAPVKIVEERRVDPSLGRDSIRSGISSALIGTVAVVAFMLVYYMVAGVIANLALMLNIVILMGVMCSVGTTLTIPGIAGIVLTIGMAVDANVLIYERIREELSAGKSLRGAISAGYDKAFGTIFDSNLTTLISSVILIFMGSGSVKGFGVALTIGVSVSMFTALVVTRLIFDWLLEKGMISKLNMLHIIKGAHFDFMNFAKPAFAISWALIVIGCGYGLYRGNNVMGVDFAGGDNLTLRFAQKVDVEKVRETITRSGVPEAFIQYQRDLVNQTENLRVTVPYETGIKVEEDLKKAFPEAKFERAKLDKVGPVVGKEIMKTAVVSSLLAMLGILIYVAMRYEFSFAVGAVIAIIHDILMTVGWFCLSGRQFSAPMVAAILTIIGFSINDTIVIFDRIREDLKMGVRGTFREVMNKALNQTLSRTIITSGTVFLATMSLYLFGGGVINDFAFTFLVGILTGTYSSIYIASALVLWWHKGERPKLMTQTVSDVAVAEQA